MSDFTTKRPENGGGGGVNTGPDDERAGILPPGRRRSAGPPDAGGESAAPREPKRASRGPKINLVSAAEVRSVQTVWLWDEWIAANKIAMLVGAPGAGKSMWAIHIASAVTTGGRLPDGSTAPLGDVVYVSTEDDMDDTLVPRLQAVGGDRRRFFEIKEKWWNPASPGACDLLETAIREKTLECRLIVLDPIITVGSKARDAYNANQIRNALEPVKRLAKNLGVAVLGISHFKRARPTA